MSFNNCGSEHSVQNLSQSPLPTFASLIDPSKLNLNQVEKGRDIAINSQLNCEEGDPQDNWFSSQNYKHNIEHYGYSGIDEPSEGWSAVDLSQSTSNFELLEETTPNILMN